MLDNFIHLWYGVYPMRRYQVYLDPRAINIFDEASEITNISRSKLIREAIDASATRLGNLLAVVIEPKQNSYSALDKLVGAVKVRGKKTVNLSENIDEVYFK